MITYPTDQVLGVVNAPERAREIVAALAAAGFPPAEVRVLAGPEGVEQLGRLGSPPNLLSRVVRVFQFFLMDQTPDFLVYEHAIRDGRTVIAVRVRNRERMDAARATMGRRGADFLNYYGRVLTEELTMWQGEEPDIPDAFRR